MDEVYDFFQSFDLFKVSTTFILRYAVFYFWLQYKYYFLLKKKFRHIIYDGVRL